MVLFRSIDRAVRSGTRPAHFALCAALFAAGFSGTAQAQKLYFRADLDGAQETPPVATPALGTAYLEMDRAATTLALRMTCTGFRRSPMPLLDFPIMAT